MCEICSSLTIKIPERHHWRHSGVFIVNFEQISHNVSIVDFELVNVGWVVTIRVHGDVNNIIQTTVASRYTAIK